MRRLVPLVLVSCAGIGPPPHVALDRDLTAAERSTRPTAWPIPRQERWILRRGATEIVFTLLVEAEGYVAMDDFGGVLADSTGQSSRAIPRSLADRMAQLIGAMSRPGDLAPVRVGENLGWHAPGILWTGDELFVDGIRVEFTSPKRYEVSGSLSATVTIG